MKIPPVRTKSSTRHEHPLNSADTNHPELQQLITHLLEDVQKAGATHADASILIESGFSLTVRKGEVETLEHHHGKSLNLTVYWDHRVGSVVTSDLSPAALRIAIEKACNIARFTEEDPFAGLADANLMAQHYPDLSLCHAWNINPQQAIALARECEAAAWAADKHITNSEGASVNTHTHYHVYANTHGFLGHYPTSYHSVSCGVIAQDGHHMESDSDYTCARDPIELMAATTVAKNAAQRTARRLGARRLSTREVPVIFAADVARGLLGNFLTAISGGNLYRKSSFLLNQLNQQVFPEHIQIHENPHVPKALGSVPFDNEGVTTSARQLIKNGVLLGYLLGSYSARKLGMASTGNAGGAHNISVEPGEHDLQGLLKEMGTGLLITDLMGQGINIVTGDYSRGAFGYWIENGEIQHPVSEITVAGNLKEMYRNLIAVGNDIDYRGNIHTGSILLKSLMIAGD